MELTAALKHKHKKKLQANEAQSKRAVLADVYLEINTDSSEEVIIARLQAMPDSEVITTYNKLFSK